MDFLQCPCCDHFTREERRAWEICPVCYREDDGHDLGDLDEPSGCDRGLTLRQGRENFQRLGACESQVMEYVCSAEQRNQYKHVSRG